MPRPFFEIYQADTWKDTKALGDRLRWKYSFRGQPNHGWGLAPTLYRWALRGGFPHGYAELHEREGWVLHDFQRRAHHHMSHPPTAEQLLEWLSLIQHYGGPTRLLDFTHSFYVAAFFAMETAESDAAVWAIDLEALGAAAAKKLGLPDVPKDRRDRIVLFGQHCEEYLRNPPDVATVIDVEPVQMNLRLAAQQGLFLFPTDLHRSFEENLFSTFDVSAAEVQQETPVLAWNADDPEWEMASVVKILLPRQMHGTAMHDLYSMNVNAFPLFGGLDGLARSLARTLWLMDPTA